MFPQLSEIYPDRSARGKNRTTKWANYSNLFAQVINVHRPTVLCHTIKQVSCLENWEFSKVQIITNIICSQTLRPITKHRYAGRQIDSVEHKRTVFELKQTTVQMTEKLRR